MTRRDRLESKLEKRQEWAGKATQRADTAYQKASAIADNIPFGQPILVGHHSEAHARRDVERIRSNMDKSVEETRLAEHHEQKASGLERQLDSSIFSDDDNAIAALEARIAEREETAARMVATNKAWRAGKGDVATFASKANISESVAQQIASKIAAAYSWEKQPYVSWELSNLRGNINRDKKRIEEIRARTARSEQADQSGGILIEGEEYVRVTFAEKPERATIDALKAVGFYWSSGSWYGRRDALPNLDN